MKRLIVVLVLVIAAGQDAPPLEELAAGILTQTIEQLRDAYPAARDTFNMYEPIFVALLIPVEGSVVAAVPCRMVEFDPDTGRGRLLRTPSGPVNSVVNWDPAIRTRSGLGVGSTLGDVRRAYGEVGIVAVEYEGWYAVADGVAFRLTDVDPSALSGWDKWDEYGNALQPELAPDSARVDQVWISAECTES